MIVKDPCTEGCSQVVTKRATKNLIAHWRVASSAAATALIFGLLSGCSGSDTVVGVAPSASTATAATAANAGVTKASLVHTPEPVAATGEDGYPNINVDTARRLGGRVRSAADQDRLEAELLALGARQRAGADAGAPASVIGELQELGRRSKQDAETLIESGASPKQP